MDFNKLYKDIMNLDKKIRFLTILDYQGRLIRGGQRDGVSNYLSPDAEKQSLRHAIESWHLRTKFSNSIGEGKYAMAEYEKIKRITMPLDKNHILYMTTEVDCDHTRLIDKIMRLKSKLS